MTPHSDDGDIPAFLRIAQDERRAAWKGRRLTVQGKAFRTIDAKEEALRKRLQREFDEQKRAKEAARLAALRERFK